MRLDVAQAYRGAPRLELAAGLRYCTDEAIRGCQLDPSAYANTTPDGGVIIGTAIGPIVRFDSSGAFVASYGRRGSGPGEYRVLFGAHVEPDGRVVLHDFSQARRLVFAPDGKPLVTHTGAPDFGVREFALDRRGFAVLRDPPAEPGDSVQSEIQLISDTLPPRIVALVPLTRLRDAQGMSAMSAFFEDVPRWAVESDSTALVASGTTLEVTRHFRDGRAVDVVRSPELGNRPVSDTDLERERQRRRPAGSGGSMPTGMRQALDRALADAEARAPAFHPFAAALRLLEDDTFVLRETLVDTDSVRWTLFDRDGAILGQLRLDVRAKVAGGRRDRLLLITPDERDVPVVGWYRVKRR